jgi:hypothetical protein
MIAYHNQLFMDTLHVHLTHRIVPEYEILCNTKIFSTFILKNFLRSTNKSFLMKILIIIRFYYVNILQCCASLTATLVCG